MKRIWLNVREWNKDVVTSALEAGVDGIMAEPENVDRIRQLGRVSVISSEAGDLSIPVDVEVFVIKGKADEMRAAEALKNKIAVVRTTDWNVIPLENLIPAGAERLMTFVRTAEEASLAAGILEKGVAGIVVESNDPGTVTEIIKFVKSIDAETFTMTGLSITDVRSIGVGDRVCVDTCSNIGPGRGILVGNSSQCLFLVHAENLENPYVSPRPFRVNAGAVHSYVRVPGNRTRYLGELKTGDQVSIIGHDGVSEIGYVGRSKIEKRPLLVLTALGPDGKEYSAVLQNAETIRLVDQSGSAISVVALKKGDIIMGYLEAGGRHFGMAVDETIDEK